MTEDYIIAGMYQNKIDWCKTNNVEFTLTFAQFKRLMLVKKCQYTGIELTFKVRGQSIKATDKVIDRIDSSIGYKVGNCLTACHAANELKSRFENPTTLLNFKHLLKMSNKIKALRIKDE